MAENKKNNNNQTNKQEKGDYHTRDGADSLYSTVSSKEKKG